MHYRLLADAVVVLHLLFIAFAMFGSLLLLRDRRWLWLHAPAAIWAASVTLIGWRCPLTPLENWLRARGGDEGYASSFIEYYLLPVIYPTNLTREIQIALGVGLVLLSAALYAWVATRVWTRTRS